MIDNIEIKIIENNHLNELAVISAECFVNDEYFDYLSQYKEEKYKLLKKIYFEGLKIPFEIGYIAGVFCNNKLIGYASVVDWTKLKQNPNYFKQLFNSESEFSNDIKTFVEKANKVKNADYLLSICILPNYQQNGLGTKLIKFILKREKTLISDIDNINSLSIYKKLSFDIEKISEKIYFVHKKRIKNFEL